MSAEAQRRDVERSEIDAAELGGVRLLTGVERGRLAGRASRGRSLTLFDLYDYARGVQVEERRAGRAAERAPRPRPTGERDGLKPFVEPRAPSEGSPLGLLGYESLKKSSKRRGSADDDDDDYDSVGRLTTGRTRPISGSRPTSSLSGRRAGG